MMKYLHATSFDLPCDKPSYEQLKMHYSPNHAVLFIQCSTEHTIKTQLVNSTCVKFSKKHAKNREKIGSIKNRSF